MYLLELAQAQNATECYRVIDEGRMFQKEQGFIQWTDDYPNEQTILDDIDAEKGYILTSDHRIAGYICIDFDGEPAYENIEGAWNSNQPYAVVHRMAFNREYRGCGLSGIAWPLIEKLCISKSVHYIRADTDFPNKRMQHILEKNGFSRCGVVIFQGSGKLAYDKILK